VYTYPFFTVEKFPFVVYCHRMSRDGYTESIRVRVPKNMKEAFEFLEKKRTKKEAELAREAFALYFRSMGIDLEQINSGQSHTEGMDGSKVPVVLPWEKAPAPVHPPHSTTRSPKVRRAAHH